MGITADGINRIEVYFGMLIDKYFKKLWVPVLGALFRLWNILEISGYSLMQIIC